MAREHVQEGMKRAQQFASQDYQEAHAMYRATLASIHTERLQLMSERAVIQAYNEDQIMTNKGT
jgi:hypothetical protein